MVRRVRGRGGGSPQHHDACITRDRGDTDANHHFRAAKHRTTTSEPLSIASMPCAVLDMIAKLAHSLLAPACRRTKIYAQCSLRTAVRVVAKRTTTLDFALRAVRFAHYG